MNANVVLYLLNATVSVDVSVYWSSKWPTPVTCLPSIYFILLICTLGMGLHLAAYISIIHFSSLLEVSLRVQVSKSDEKWTLLICEDRNYNSCPNLLFSLPLEKKTIYIYISFFFFFSGNIIFPACPTSSYNPFLVGHAFTGDTSKRNSSYSLQCPVQELFRKS